jgi:hypothetical protein
MQITNASVQMEIRKGMALIGEKNIDVISNYTYWIDCSGISNFLCKVWVYFH